MISMDRISMKPTIAGTVAKEDFLGARGDLLHVLENQGVHVDPSLEVTLDEILARVVQAGQTSVRGVF